MFGGYLYVGRGLRPRRVTLMIAVLAFLAIFFVYSQHFFHCLVTFFFIFVILERHIIVIVAGLGGALSLNPYARASHVFARIFGCVRVLDHTLLLRMLGALELFHVYEGVAALYMQG
uniref:Uncharacterized protein n=1 Tax=Trypanosoma congolense (strain IL3000) TaxID=1068625 RepID=G0US58_TRYCI|nr:hypothetical protein, unlikely [Trypanosoma congolense IL3000]